MKTNPLMSLSGWEAFTHGVFAIAVTRLVLDIRVPDSATIDNGSALISASARSCRATSPTSSASSLWARIGSRRTGSWAGCVG